MSNHARRRVASAPPEDSFWTKVWENIEPAVGAMVEDIILFTILIAGLTIVYGALVGLALLGYSPERIDTFETIHYWANVAVLIVFMFNLVVRIVLHTLRKRP